MFNLWRSSRKKKKKKTSTAHCGRVWKVLTEQRGSFIDDKSCEVVLYTPFQTERDCVFFTQHVGEICCRVADRNLPWVCSTCFLFWNLLDLKAISVFVTFFFFWRVEVWHYLDLCKKKKSMIIRHIPHLRNAAMVPISDNSSLNFPLFQPTEGKNI